MALFFGITGALLAALFLTSFVKFLTALNILRYGIGLGDAPFGIIIVGLSMALSLVVMNPKISSNGGVDGLLQANTVSIEQSYRPFLEQHTDKKMVERIAAAQSKLVHVQSSEKQLAEKLPQVESKSTESKPTPFTVLVAAFLVSEISAAFSLGVLFLIPFVVIDLAVANLLMALGVTQISQRVIALPVKLLLFVAVDGWALISEKLLTSYLS